MFGDLDSLPEEDKLRMSSMIDHLQIRDRSAQIRSDPPFLISSQLGFLSSSINFLDFSEVGLMNGSIIS